MPPGRKSALPKVLDIPFIIGLLLTVGFFLLVSQESMKHTIVARYTTEHAVEYVIVWFFIWGLADVAFRACMFPGEFMALRQPWLPPRGPREPVSQATLLLAQVQKKPRWLQDSRIGQRLIQALAYLKDNGSAAELPSHLRYLADIDEEKSHGNYGLVRFICWVTPMLGFLGTVVHFGTALGGQEAKEIGDKLPTVVAEMGTAFNTTTVALIAATSMMFCLFLCERCERSMLHTIDRKVERDLLHRFEMHDANMGPFLAALEASTESNLRAMDATLERQLQIWNGAFESLAQHSEQRIQSQAALWEDTLGQMRERFDASDDERQRRLLEVLELMAAERQQHRGDMHASTEQVAAVQAHFARLVEGLTAVLDSKGEVVKLQAVLADNLRLLRETQQIDQALHGLTAAIHLLTARSPSGMIKDRAA